MTNSARLSYQPHHEVSAIRRLSATVARGQIPDRLLRDAKRPRYPRTILEIGNRTKPYIHIYEDCTI